MSLRSAISFIGPLIGPIMAGFASIELGWRAVFWRVNPCLIFSRSVAVADFVPFPRIALSLPVATFISVLLMPETLASAILRRKAAKLNKEALNTGKVFVAPSDLKRESAWVEYVSTTSRDISKEPTDVKQRTTLSRPWRLLFGEMVVSLSCAYLGFVYAVFYMYAHQPLNEPLDVDIVPGFCKSSPVSSKVYTVLPLACPGFYSQ